MVPRFAIERRDGSRPASARILPFGIVVALALALIIASTAWTRQAAPDVKSQGEGAAAARSAPGPRIAARAWALIDARDGAVLARNAAGRRLPIASATKLMTAYVALRRLRPSRTVVAPRYDALTAESLLGLRAGERMTVRDLLYALMLPSANDAAVTLARASDRSIPAFVARMNRTARALGLDDTSYANPIGLDDPASYSSAADLTALARRLLREPLIAKIADTPIALLRSGDRPRRIETRNTLLLSDPSVNGLKTGHTRGAGYVLVGSARRGGTTLISAVLGAASESARDAETSRLLDYGFGLYRPGVAIGEGEVLASPEVRFGDERLDLVAAKDLEVTVRRGEQIETVIDAPGEVEGPIDPGERVGRATAVIGGEAAGSVPLVADRRVDKAGLFQRVRSSIPAAVAVIPAAAIVIMVVLLLLRRDARPANGSRGAPAEERTPEERRRMHDQRRKRRDRDDERGGEGGRP